MGGKCNNGNATYTGDIHAHRRVYNGRVIDISKKNVYVYVCIDVYAYAYI